MKCFFGIFFILLFGTLFSPADELSVLPLELDGSVAPEYIRLLREVNAIRAEAGAGECGIDPAAQRAAAVYAAKIIELDRFSHVDGRGRKGVDRYRDAGGHALRTGEVLGKGPDIESVVEAWEKSRMHRSVITDTAWTHLGAGAAEIPSGGVVAVLLFTRRVFIDISVEELRGKNGIFISGRFTGAGQPAIVVNGKPKELRIEKPGSGGSFEYICPEQHAVYFIRFGIMTEDGFSAAETAVFDPGSS